MFKSDTLHITAKTDLYELVLKNPDVILFLEHFNVKLPYRDQTVGSVCAEKGIPVNIFIAFANLYLAKETNSNIKLSVKDLPNIISYLRNCHSYYLDEIYPKIQQCITNLNKDGIMGEIRLLENFFADYLDEVKEHLDYENNVLYPYVIRLHEKFVSDEKNSYTVNEYKDRHNDIEEKLNDLMNLLVRYLPNQENQEERRILIQYLVELDYDLKIHTLIEDSILIPLIEKLELEINTNRVND